MPETRTKISTTTTRTENPSAAAPRMAYIDGLRGMAIILVLLTHTWAASGAPALSMHILRHHVSLAAIPALGWVGVDLFLVLSGFCISWPFMRDAAYRERMDLKQFLLRRVRRICPAYFISIALSFTVALGFVCLLPVLPQSRLAAHPNVFAIPSIGEIWPHLLFIHNLSTAHAHSINGSYWSLGLEFQLYILFPILLELFTRWNPVKTLIVVLVLQVAFRTMLTLLLPPVFLLSTGDAFLVKCLFARMFDFAIGMMAAYLIARKELQRPVIFGRTGTLLTGLILASAFLLTDHVNAVITDILWPVGFAMLLCQGSQHNTICHRCLSYKPLVQVGLISYSIYLIHEPLIERTGYLLELYLSSGPAFLLALCFIPVVIGISAVFFKFVEDPFIKHYSQPKSPKPHAAETVVSAQPGMPSDAPSHR